MSGRVVVPIGTVARRVGPVSLSLFAGVVGERTLAKSHSA